MSTRKRSRAQEDEDLPPAKREPDLDNPEGVGASSSVGTGVRQGEQQAGDGQAFERDEEFWLDDGTAILVACNVEFRFYKGLLASVSPVFKQLFADCQVARTVPMDHEQTFSCPVVHVSDSPEDLRYVLRTSSSKRPGRLFQGREPSCQEIFTAIRLGRKYRIAELYSQSMEYLQSYFPDTPREDGDKAVFVPPGWKELDAIGVINLARLTGELSLLPSAFVTCICAKSTGTNGIVHGNVRVDGSKEHLSPNDLAICFNGKTSLRIAAIGAIFRIYKPAFSPECERSGSCKTALSNVLVDLGGGLDLLLDGELFSSSSWKFSVRRGYGMCSACAYMVDERILRERKDIWNRLPELLGIDIPGWGQEPASPPPPEPEGCAM